MVLLAVYAWAMLLGCSSDRFVQHSPKLFTQGWYQLSDVADSFHHTLPSPHSDYTADSGEKQQFPTADFYGCSWKQNTLVLIKNWAKEKLTKATNSLVNKNKTALLYPFHFFL